MDQPYIINNPNSIRLVEGEYDLQTAYAIAKNLIQEIEAIAMLCRLIAIADAGAFTTDYNYKKSEQDDKYHVGDDFREIINPEIREELATTNPEYDNTALHEHVKTAWNKYAPIEYALDMTWSPASDYIDVHTTNLDAAKKFREFVYHTYINPFLTSAREQINYDAMLADFNGDTK